jgi:hypothetical protein
MFGMVGLHSQPPATRKTGCHDGDGSFSQGGKCQKVRLKEIMKLTAAEASQLPW